MTPVSSAEACPGVASQPCGLTPGGTSTVTSDPGAASPRATHARGGTLTAIDTAPGSSDRSAHPDQACPNPSAASVAAIAVILRILIASRPHHASRPPRPRPPLAIRRAMRIVLAAPGRPARRDDNLGR